MSSPSRALVAGVALFARAALSCAAIAPARDSPPSASLLRAPSSIVAPLAVVAPPLPPTADAMPAQVAQSEPVVLTLPLDREARELPAGRSVVEIEVPEGRFVSIGVFGPMDALLGFDVVGPAATAALEAHAPLDEDGRLPLVTSFATPAGIASIRVVVDASDPVSIARLVADPMAERDPDPRALRLGTVAPRTLIGLPAPLARSDGYFLEAPGRYQFVRLDVARALTAALRQTRIRFHRDPIAIGDITQWNGERPATDLGHPRHISHAGGRDVDIALPAADDEPSTIRAHCTGVLITPETYVCAPGSGRGLDALRLAYLLGLLVDGIGDEPSDAAHVAKAEGRIEKIFADDAFIREIRSASEVLRSRRWIKEAGFAALSEDGILRASPWHVDHVHVRFGGEPGKSPWSVVPSSPPTETE